MLIDLSPGRRGSGRLPLGAQDPKCKSITQIEGAWGKGQELGSRHNAAKAREAVADLLPVMQSLREQGESLRRIASRLNLLNQRTRGGNPWSATQVKRVLDRAAPLSMAVVA